MAARFMAGDTVQTPFGKGVVRQVQNSGRLLVDVEERALVVAASELSKIDAGRKRSRSRETPSRNPTTEHSHPHREPRDAPAEVDLHGLTVGEALERAEVALNEALLANLPELRLVHGRSGGRIRTALQRLLRATPSIRGYRLDPRNDGVTIVSL